MIGVTTDAPADGILPFPGASGRGLKIVVIDSCVISGIRTSLLRLGA